MSRELYSGMNKTVMKKYSLWVSDPEIRIQVQIIDFQGERRETRIGSEK